VTPAEVERLGTQGWFERSAFPAAADAAAVALRRADLGLFKPAGVSRGQVLDATVRNDAILWIEPGDAELAPLHAAFEALRGELNRDAWLGLTRFELQLAHYPADGARYVRHRDAFEGEPRRRVTAIVYLNPDWQPAHGGQLVLHTEPAVEIAPRLGQSVIFLAAKVEHEVLPTHARRLAATAWYHSS
jgi:SM-20-related protein